MTPVALAFSSRVRCRWDGAGGIEAAYRDAVFTFRRGARAKLFVAGVRNADGVVRRRHCTDLDVARVVGTAAAFASHALGFRVDVDLAAGLGAE